MPLFSRTPSPHPPSAPTSDLAASNQRVFRLARHSRATSDGFVEHRTSGATTTGTAEEMTAALRRSEGDERLGRPLSGAVVVTPTGGVAPSVDSSKGPGPDKRASGSSFGSRSTTKGGRRLLGSLFSRKDDGPQPGRLEAEAALEGRRGQDKAADVVDKADGSDKVVLERPHSVADTRLRRPSSSFTPTRIGPGVGRPPTPSSPAPHPNRLSRSSSASQIYDPALLTRSILPRFFSPSSSSSVSTEGPIADRRASSALGTYEASGLVEGHHALGAQDPPTDSLKALSQLSGLPLRALVDGGAKGIERLTGTSQSPLLRFSFRFVPSSSPFAALAPWLLATWLFVGRFGLGPSSPSLRIPCSCLEHGPRTGEPLLRTISRSSPSTDSGRPAVGGPHGQVTPRRSGVPRQSGNGQSMLKSLCLPFVCSHEPAVRGHPS